MAILTVNPDYKLIGNNIKQMRTNAHQITGVAAKPGKSN